MDIVEEFKKKIKDIKNTEDYSRILQNLKNHRIVLNEHIKAELQKDDEVIILDKGKELFGIILKVNRTRAQVKLYDHGKPDAVWNVPLSMITKRKWTYIMEEDTVNRFLNKEIR